MLSVPYKGVTSVEVDVTVDGNDDSSTAVTLTLSPTVVTQSTGGIAVTVTGRSMGRYPRRMPRSRRRPASRPAWTTSPRWRQSSRSPS